MEYYESVINKEIIMKKVMKKTAKVVVKPAKGSKGAMMMAKMASGPARMKKGKKC